MGIHIVPLRGKHRSPSVLRGQLEAVARTPAGKRAATALVEFVTAQSREVPTGHSLPASSEVLESLIGKGKRKQGQHVRGDFTKLLLGMGASVLHITQDRVGKLWKPFVITIGSHGLPKR